MENIELDGMIFRGSSIELLQGKLLIIQGKTGMLGCVRNAFKNLLCLNP